MQYLHHLTPFINVDFLVKNLNSPWAKEGPKLVHKVVSCPTAYLAKWLLVWHLTKDHDILAFIPTSNSIN
jgi:hypothetical protein